MLDALKRMFSRGSSAASWQEIDDWARRNGHGFKRARDDGGVVVDGLFGPKPWRLEWGPSQRNYIVGGELRLRIELGLPNRLQLLVLARPLMLQLEREAFKKFTDGTQTRIDAASPEEMRWLAMLPQYALEGESALRGRIGAAGHPTSALARWLNGALSDAIERAGHNLLAYPAPFVLIVSHGRLSLRCALPVLSAPPLEQALELFKVAAEQAIQTAQARTSSGWPTTAANAWHSQLPAEGSNPPR